MTHQTALRTIAQELEDRAAQLRNIAKAPSDVVTPAPAHAPTPASAPILPSHKIEVADYFSDYGKFFDFLRGNKMLGPDISKSEFQGCDAIIGAFASYGSPVSYCAYGLATAYLETANTMQPIKEIGGRAYFTRMYDITGARAYKAKELGNLDPGDGAIYPGRGYVQLTGKGNYIKATKKLRAMGFDVDFVANPDDVMKPQYAAIIMVVGMTEGWFTGRSLKDDLLEDGPSTYANFTDSRDIINGRDKQKEIAGYAIDFQTGLLAGAYKGAARG